MVRLWGFLFILYYPCFDVKNRLGTLLFSITASPIELYRLTKEPVI